MDSPHPKSVPKAQAARELRVSVNSVRQLIDANLLVAGERTRVDRGSLDALKARSERGLPQSHPPILQVVKNPRLRGSSMYLSKTDHLSLEERRAREGYLTELYRRGGAEWGEHVDFTGFWEVSDRHCDLLITKQGLVVSTVVGFGSEVARILAEADRQDYRNRRVFAVEPLSPEEAAPFLIRYPGLVRHARTIPSKRGNPGDVAQGPGIVPGSSHEDYPQGADAGKDLPDGMPNLFAFLAPARIEPYRRACRDDEAQAIHLYNWGARLEGAVMELMAHVEPILRHAIDEAMRRWADSTQSGGEWFDRLPTGQKRGRDQRDVKEARSRAEREAKKKNRTVTRDDIVAQLNLGFWRYLVSQKNLTSLWIPALHAAFPHGPDDLRTRLHGLEAMLERLLNLRNRAAHHEPLLSLDLAGLWTDAQTVLEWISPYASQDVQAVAGFPEIIADRP